MGKIFLRFIEKLRLYIIKEKLSIFNPKRGYMTQWYYVEGTERIGPLNQDVLEEYLAQGTVTLETYVWRKGFPNWVKAKDIEELAIHAHGETIAEEVSEEDSSKGAEVRERRSGRSSDQNQSYEKDIKVENIDPRALNLSSLSSLDREFYIKVGMDREEPVEIEYGPYSMEDLQLMFSQNRINEKTFITTTNADKWSSLADFELIEKITDKKLIKPHLNTNDPVYLRTNCDGEVVEGLIRDLSLGGGQFLTKEILPLQRKLKANLIWGNRKPVGVHFVVTRRLEDRSGYVIRFITLTSNLRALIENVFQLE